MRRGFTLRPESEKDRINNLTIALYCAVETAMAGLAWLTYRSARITHPAIYKNPLSLSAALVVTLFLVTDMYKMLRDGESAIEAIYNYLRRK